MNGGRDQTFRAILLSGEDEARQGGQRYRAPTGFGHVASAAQSPAQFWPRCFVENSFSKINFQFRWHEPDFASGGFAGQRAPRVTGPGAQ